MRRLPVRLCFPVAAAAASLLACDLFYPEARDDRLIMMVPLYPDWGKHRVWLAPASGAAEPPEATVRMYRRDPRAGKVSWTLVAVTTEPGTCLGHFWPGYENRVSFCLDPGAPLDPGAAYMVEASAEGYRTARGQTLVVGDFDVESAVLTRTGASAMLNASWTGSVAAHRYFVSLRRRGGLDRGNPKGWYTEVDGTLATVPVPGYAIEEAIDPLKLDVAALSKELHAYLTSGTEGSRFSVPPVQNIENGFGFVGSIRIRSLPVSSK